MGMDVQTPLLRGYFEAFFGHSWKRVVGILNEAFLMLQGLIDL